MKIKPLFFLLFFFANHIAEAQISVASIFSDNMVLQRNATIPIWGFAKANEKITVQFHNQTKSTKSDKNGKWIVRLESENAGGPFILSVKGKNKICVKNILVGEVWLCSGQSNMEWTVGQSDNAKNEIATANFPNIRHIKIPKEVNSLPNTNFKIPKWEVCSPETVANFTGVGYFYAKQLNDNLGIPIGLINASWSGTNIETWISREGFESSDEFKEMIANMPKVDLDALLNLKLKNEKQRIENLQKHPLNTANISQYSELNFDDSSWLELQQPKIWEAQSLGNFDGIVWLRKHFKLSSNEINEVISIEIPAIDDDDITYVNGVKVGETKGWDIKRMYSIPIEILKEGDNVISIRVADNGGSGGIHGNEKELKLALKIKEIPLSGNWKFQVETIKSSVNENEFPSLCYNAMINPLIPFAFKGVLWYQGESNALRAFQYRRAFPLLIKDWRAKFNQGDFPFYFVQLANFKTKGDSNTGCSWAELREAQTQTLNAINTAMVVTTDIGNQSDIHPTNKKEIGNRLASIALNNLYNKKAICSGPTYKSFKNNENNTIVTFENYGSELLTSTNTNAVFGFEVADINKVFYPAKATIINKDKISINCDKVLNPVAIRFAWIGATSECNLFNKEGLPVVPFRTDDWDLSTKNIKYALPILESAK